MRGRRDGHSQAVKPFFPVASNRDIGLWSVALDRWSRCYPTGRAALVPIRRWNPQLPSSYRAALYLCTDLGRGLRPNITDINLESIINTVLYNVGFRLRAQFTYTQAQTPETSALNYDQLSLTLRTSRKADCGIST